MAGRKTSPFIFETGQSFEQARDPWPFDRYTLDRYTLPQTPQNCCGFQFTWDPIFASALLPQLPGEPPSSSGTQWIQVIQNVQLAGNELQGLLVNIEVLNIGDSRWIDLAPTTQCPQSS
jgi:hypothetical protein